VIQLVREEIGQERLVAALHDPLIRRWPPRSHKVLTYASNGPAGVAPLDQYRHCSRCGSSGEHIVAVVVVVKIREIKQAH